MNHHGPITKAHQPVRDRDALLPAALEVVLDRHGDMRGGVFGGFGAAEILPTLRGAMKSLHSVTIGRPGKSRLTYCPKV